MKAQLIKGKHEICVRIEDGKHVEVMSLEKWNSKLKTPIVPPTNWKA